MTPVDPYILQQASCQASLLVSTAGFRSDYWEDLKQEMVLDLLHRSPQFDQTRGEGTASCEVSPAIMPPYLLCANVGARRNS